MVAIFACAFWNLRIKTYLLWKYYRYSRTLRKQLLQNLRTWLIVSSQVTVAIDILMQTMFWKHNSKLLFFYTTSNFCLNGGIGILLELQQSFKTKLTETCLSEKNIFSLQKSYQCLWRDNVLGDNLSICAIWSDVLYFYGAVA